MATFENICRIVLLLSLSDINLYFLLSSAVSNLAGVTIGKKRASARVTKAEYEELAAFRYSLRQFLSFSESAAASAGITPRQYQAILAIQGFPGRDSATIGELAEQLQIAHHSAVGLVDRLVAQKLIVRVASAGDRRQVYVSLTARGIEILDKLASAHKDELRRLGPRLNSIVLALNRHS
jgi:DNA-binding MarR family transcriptional regulator